jgi:hypothetical protein
MIEIYWKKEFKNSVRFFVFLNGVEMGSIKRGESISFAVDEGANTLRFVPKSPAFFGWKCLEIDIDARENPKLTLSVQYSAIGPVSSTINPLNQLHVYEYQNLDIINEQHVKK